MTTRRLVFEIRPGDEFIAGWIAGVLGLCRVEILDKAAQEASPGTFCLAAFHEGYDMAIETKPLAETSLVVAAERAAGRLEIRSAVERDSR